MSRFIDPTTDFGFKKLFGEEASKDIIMSFIYDILELEEPLEDISFLSNKQLPETTIMSYIYNELGQEEPPKDMTLMEQMGVYDMLCRCTDGTQFIVEIQKDEIFFIKDRMIYYSTFPIVAHAKKERENFIKDGKEIKIPWDYEFSSIYCIIILNYFLSTNGTCVKRTNIKSDELPNDIFSDKFKYITIELSLFNKTKPQYSLDKHLNKWLYFLSELENFEKIPQIFKDEIVFQHAFEISQIANLTPEDRRFYEQSLKRSRDSNASMSYDREEAEQKGIKKGIKKVAKAMLDKGMEISSISALTGLSEEEIKKLII